MECVLKMIMSPFWREVKRRVHGGVGGPCTDRMAEGVHRHEEPAPEPTPALGNPEPEIISPMQNCADNEMKSQ